MLNNLDDFAIHQTPEPIAHPASSDRNVYDRTWFNGYTADGSAYFGIGIAIYPHRRVLDCAFSVVEAGGRQHCFYGSRLAPLERTEMDVGPFRLEIIEPMRQARVVLDDNESRRRLRPDVHGTHGTDPRGPPGPARRHPPGDGRHPVRPVRVVDRPGQPPRRHARRRRLVRHQGPLLGGPRCRRARPAWRPAGRTAQRVLPVGAAVLGRPRVPRRVLRRPRRRAARA